VTTDEVITLILEETIQMQLDGQDVSSIFQPPHYLTSPSCVNWSAWPCSPAAPWPGNYMASDAAPSVAVGGVCRLSTLRSRRRLRRVDWNAYAAWNASLSSSLSKKKT